MNQKSKVCFVGDAGVGKTSLVSLLQGKKISKEISPTVGLEIEDSVLNGAKCSIWDCGGQKRFQFLWKDFLRASGLTVLVCDSTEENVRETKDIIERFSSNLKNLIVLANKQDIDGALPPESVEKKLGIKTYGISALRKEQQSKLRKILEREIKLD